MKYKYITGQVLEIDSSSGWTDGTLLSDIYPKVVFHRSSQKMSQFLELDQLYIYISFLLMLDISFLNASLIKAFVISDLVLSMIDLALSAYLLSPPVSASG